MTPVTVWQGRVGKCECGKPTRERRESTFDDDSPQILRQLDFGELIVSSLLAVTRFVEQEENDRTSCERACHDYSPNTTIDKIWTRYVFDRRLRLVFMDALELLEVWNRKLGIMPMIPNRKNDSDWHQPIVVGNDRVFGVLTLLKYSLDRVAL